ncbi:hypothetical protein AGE04_23385 [Salmonella enterica subsp. enterica serovar Kentucky]|nr:hypothetical protein AGE04_23385 [Salmonella enterica subsp. enterica serovar Kentucky]
MRYSPIHNLKTLYLRKDITGVAITIKRSVAQQKNNNSHDMTIKGAPGDAPVAAKSALWVNNYP